MTSCRRIMKRTQRLRTESRNWFTSMLSSIAIRSSTFRSNLLTLTTHIPKRFITRLCRSLLSLRLINFKNSSPGCMRSSTSRCFRVMTLRNSCSSWPFTTVWKSLFPSTGIKTSNRKCSISKISTSPSTSNSPN